LAFDGGAARVELGLLQLDDIGNLLFVFAGQQFRRKGNLATIIAFGEKTRFGRSLSVAFASGDLLLCASAGPIEPHQDVTPVDD